MLKIIYGTANSVEEQYVDNLIATNIKNNTFTYILVPEQFSLSAEKSLLENFGIKAQSHAKVITFSALCNLVFAKLGPLRLKYIDGAGKQILAARTIRALKGKVGPLSNSLRRRGFSSEIVKLISELKRYSVTPDVLSASSHEVDDEELSAKLKDISLIFDTFDTFLNTQSADAEDNLNLILPKIKDCDFLEGSLFVRHFRSFTPIEHNILGELMKKLDVYVELCCDDVFQSRPLFQSAAETYRRLVETATSYQIPVAEPIRIKDNPSENELSYLAENYFSYQPKPCDTVLKNIKIYEVSNHYREVEAAADLVLRLCRTENKRFSDFLILARSPETYTGIAPSIFQSRGIDIFLDKRRSILSNPICRLICSSLDILSDGFSYERIMSIAKTGLTDASDTDIDIFENYLLAVNPSHAMWNDAVWTYAPKEYDIDNINETRDKVLSFVTSLKNSLSGKRTAKDFCSAIIDALATCGLLEKTDEICKNFSEKAMPYLADEYRQVWNSVISVITQISTLMDDEYMSRRDFSDLFKNACNGITVGLAPQTQGSVILSSIDKFRSVNTPVVIVLGMTDGVFPAPHSSEGIISDLERAELLKLGIQLAPGTDFKQREEQSLIYSVLSAAKEKLYLFSPLSDSNGKPLYPSSVISNIKKHTFPNIEVINPDKCGILRGTESREAAFELLCTLLSDVKGNIAELNDAEQSLFDYFNTSVDYTYRLEKICNQLKATEPQKLSREAVDKIYGTPIKLSASKLEKYNSCAFAYFLSYGLFAKERETSGIEPRSTGSIQHEALYRYFTNIKNSGIDYSNITRDMCYRDMYSLVKEEALKNNELLYESSSYYKYFITKMQGITARTAWEVIKFYRTSSFRPIGFEIKIDTDGEIPKLEIKDDNNRTIANVKGMIDKADITEVNGEKYIAITDYKSSAKVLDEKLAAAGVNLQPLLYSDIICKRMNANPAAMLYMQMTDPIVDASKVSGGISEETLEKAINKNVSFNGWMTDKPAVVSSYSPGGENGENYRLTQVDDTELNNRIAAANEKIRTSAMEILNGNISADPYCDKKYNACQYCFFNRNCENCRL